MYRRPLKPYREHVASCEASLNTYNRKVDYIHHVPHYMFSARCRAEKVDEFTKFLLLVATVNLGE